MLHLCKKIQYELSGDFNKFKQIWQHLLDCIRATGPWHLSDWYPQLNGCRWFPMYKINKISSSAQILILLLVVFSPDWEEADDVVVCYLPHFAKQGKKQKKTLKQTSAAICGNMHTEPLTFTKSNWKSIFYAHERRWPNNACFHCVRGGMNEHGFHEIRFHTGYKNHNQSGQYPLHVVACWFTITTTTHGAHTPTHTGPCSLTADKDLLHACDY